MEPEGSLPHSQEPAGPRLCIVYGERGEVQL
jgi:hypothetical protein